MAQSWPNQCLSSASGNQIDPLAPCSQDVPVLEGLLAQPETAVGASARAPCVVDPATDQQLVERRLGNAAGLFVALKCKDAATATHCLQVALLCSAWAREMRLPAEKREEIEVAALLHDVGVIGVPDRILHKPAQLETREMGIFAYARGLSQEILRANGASAGLVAIVKHIPVWYNAAPGGDGPAGPETPRESRMIAIAEAFDSMTTDHVFRPARSKEMAVEELVRCSGTQFDPLLVEQFAEIAGRDLTHLYRQLASQWLLDLQHHACRAFAGPGLLRRRSQQTDVTARFQEKILEKMRDCVIMVDPALNVIGWNRRAEQLTGILAQSIVERPWQPETTRMRDDEGRLVLAPRCPLRQAVATGMPSAGRFSLTRPEGDQVAVEAEILPVLDQDGSLLGAAMIMRDISSERSLEKLCENLQSKVTADPLTNVFNRAEFDRVHADLVKKYAKTGSVFSVIICDLDHFKQINDSFGHQAGDEVLKKTAAILQEACRPTDLVARYGGEEFVILCSDCGVSAATRRAEHIRDVISRTEHRLLGGHRATASFGVTQIQAGDTAETVLRRVDRALYLAKDQGRNRVIQLGMGTRDEEPARRWAFWRRKKPSSPEVLAEEDMIAPGPIRFALEKLRGFVADHQAVIKRTEENSLEFELVAPVYNARRKTDLRYVFTMTLRFWEEPLSDGPASRIPEHEASQIRIRVLVLIGLEETPGRPDGELTDYARQVVTSLRAYLMAKRAGELPKHDADLERKKILLPVWKT